MADSASAERLTDPANSSEGMERTRVSRPARAMFDRDPTKTRIKPPSPQEAFESQPCGCSGSRRGGIEARRPLPDHQGPGLSGTASRPRPPEYRLAEARRDRRANPESLPAR